MNLIDTGLACYIVWIRDTETLLASIFAGAFMKTYVVNENTEKNYPLSKAVFVLSVNVM